MADVLIDENVMAGLGSLIRETEGSTTLYYPAEMVPKFRELIGAGDGSGEIVSAVLEELEVTENGEYLPGTGVDGFSKVTVNVPSAGGGVLYDLLTSLGYTVLFADGEFHNTDVVTVNTFETTVGDNGCLITANTDAAGVWTSGADGRTIGILAKFDDTGAYYTQYGRSKPAGSLPKIQTTGANRVSFTELRGTANQMQVYSISGTNEKFLGTGTNCILEIMAIYIIP